MPATQRWKVVFFEEEDGSEPVKEYIRSIKREKERAVLIRTIELLQNIGPEIQGTNMDKLIDGSIRELRKDRHRILYGRLSETFILLTAFLKRTDETPAKEIELAKERFRAYQARLQNKQ